MNLKKLGAIDASGQRVPTRYEVRGPLLVQHVEHRAANVEYPVVADPVTYLGWLRVWTDFTKSETQWISDNRGSLKKYLPIACGLIPHPLPAVACGGYSTYVLDDIAKVAKKAAKDGRCIRINIAYQIAPLAYWYDGSDIFTCKK